MRGYIMKSRILLCCAAAAILYAGCSLIKSDAPAVPQTDNTAAAASATDNQSDSEELPVQPSTQPMITEADELPTDNPSPETEAVTQIKVKAPESTEPEAVTTPTTDGTEPSETEAPTQKTDAASDVSEEEPDIDPNYMYQTEDDFFFVVNKQLLLPEDYDIKLDYVQGDYKMEETAAKHMRDMIAAAKEDGIELKILSTYRTVKYQKNLFERNVKSRMEDNGMSYEDAYYDTSINIAPPGGSEHNAGLAADIITMDDWDTYEGFEDTEEFAWLQEHAWEYGYILRYLKGKEDITGYIYEPWHYRYVGVKYAKTVRDSGLSLEEYFEQFVWTDGSEPTFPWDKLV